MTTRDTPFTAGTPCWVDLLTSDADASTAFYTGLFGWTAERAGEEFGNYVTYTLDGAAVAGQTPNQPDLGSPDAWTTYLASDDCEATVGAAESAGARVVFPTMAVGEVGTMAILQDPAGAALGIWQAGQHTGFGRYNEPGSVTWDEVQSKDFAASSAFYTEAFGWELVTESDTDDFRYSNAKVAGEMVAGLMDASGYLPAEVPSHWTIYFSVGSADEASAKVQELGGTVVQEAQDTPYGRIVVVSDPTGAQFRLHQALAATDS